jgi:hypothetical protein
MQALVVVGISDWVDADVQLFKLRPYLQYVNWKRAVAHTAPE